MSDSRPVSGAPIPVLIVEDDPTLADHLAATLMGAGWQPRVAATLAAARVALGESETALIVLDRMLPDGDGLDLLADTRLRGAPIPALVLSALGDLPARIDGLEAGADDYLVKPFEADELVARARAILRRAARPVAEETLTVRDLVIHIGGRQLYRAGKRIALSDKEFDLVLCLAQAGGGLVTRQMLLKDVWGIARAIETNVVDVTINRLRRKLEEGFDTAILHTVRRGQVVPGSSSEAGSRGWVLA